MSIQTGAVYLGNNQPRRAGLTKAGYKHASLLRTINPSPNVSPSNMRPRAVTNRSSEVEKPAVKEETEGGIERPPESSSDEEDNSRDIPKTQWGPKSLNLEEERESKGVSSTRSKAEDGHGPANKDSGTSAGRSRKNANPKPSSSNSSTGSVSTTKRKGEEDTTRLGARMMDEFGRPVVKKARQGYGKSKQQPKLLVPKMKGRRSDPEREKTEKAKMERTALEDSPKKADTSVPQTLKRPPSILSSPSSTPEQKGGFIKPPKHDFTPTRTKTDKKPATFKRYSAGSSDEDSTNEPSNRLPLVGRFKKPPVDLSPVKEKEKFKSYTFGLEKNVISAAQNLIGKERNKFELISTETSEDDIPTMTQAACCPMCGVPVSPDDIKAHSKHGFMNIRVQGEFCKAHRMKTAKGDWELNNYPRIDWDNLDSRITKHYTFIKKLIRGQDSHYGQLFNEKVDAGMDRNLMKMTSNLTPGYYGARGLQAISGNLFKKFTPLLKKRMVEDPLMSARGYSAYVQSVLVPEVTVLLIMEDMSVDVEQGRQILSDSVGIGELLNEEIEDVVSKKVVDSEGEDESD